MFLSKMKILAAVVFVTLLMGAGAGLWMRPAPAAELPAPAGQEAARQDDARPDDEEKPRKPDAGERRSRGHFKAEAVVKKTFRTGSAPRVVVATFNGPITVTASTDGSVDVQVTKQTSAPTQEQADKELENIDVSMTQEGDDVRITAKRKEEQRHNEINAGATATLHVPPGSVLELQGSNGSVEVDRGSGELTVRTSNGKIETKNHRGRLNLKTSNGRINVGGGQGQMELHSSNGPIDIKAEKAAVTAHTANGAISFKGTLAGGSHVLQTSNSKITVTLPGTSEFEIDAETSNGTVTTSFSDRSSNDARSSRRVRLQTTIGEKPSISMKLRTSNGNIRVEKAGD